MTGAGTKFHLSSPSISNVNAALVSPYLNVCHVFLSVFYIVLCIYCFFPPSSPIGPGTTAVDVVEYDSFVDDQSLATKLLGKQSPSPLPHIAYLSVFNSCIRHCCCCTLIPILLHSLSLSPFIIVPYPMLPSINISFVGPTPLSICYA